MENDLTPEARLARLLARERNLVAITAMLSSACDLETLLERIMTSLREATTSDAGTLYVIEKGDHLRFAVAQNASREIPFKSFTLPISEATIAGYVASTGETLAIEDVYHMPASLPCSFKSDFDTRFGYRTRSMLVVPMRNRDGRIVGVVQLINRKRSAEARVFDEATANAHVIAYGAEDVEFLGLLASQAGIAIERASLYDGIERLLRGFVDSSTTSIEARDKVTGGHSQRIAAYTVVLAKRMSRAGEGAFAPVRFSREDIRELFYAAMLHDIGKIGVREYVLCKENKLSNDRMETIRLRIELERLYDPARAAWCAATWEFLKGVNIPKFLDDAGLARLQALAGESVHGADGVATPLLSTDDLEKLSVRKGNLTDAERREIQSHVVHSRSILEKIPWTEDLKRVPLIAGLHHEKPNGKGYPDGLTIEALPLEARLLAVADVFEALTAMDRPYKPAMPVAKAIEILRLEAKDGGLDADIVDFFAREEIHAVISDDLRKRFTLSPEEILGLE
jgi:HD-GYP domain-containing protein (c-di-GMP phosphodiesterase class II)